MKPPTSHEGLVQMIFFPFHTGGLKKFQPFIFQGVVASGKLTWLAGKWTWIEDVFPIENGGFSIAMLVYRSIPEAA